MNEKINNLVFSLINPDREIVNNAGKISFKNEPKLSEHEADQKFNERRIALVPQIKDLLATTDLFKDKEIEVEFSYKGVSSLVCFVEASNERYVLKVPLSLTDGNGEADFLRTWEEVGVKVPHVYQDGKLGEHPYLIMEYVEAETLQDALKTENNPDLAWKEMGGTLAQMHTPKREGFGKIVEGKPQYQTFKEWLFGENTQKYIKKVQELGLLGDLSLHLNY